MLEFIPAESGRLIIRCAGSWTRDDPRPPLRVALEELHGFPAGGVVEIDASELTRWDSTFVVFVRDLDKAVRAENRALDCSALPDGIRRLLALANETENAGAARRNTRPGILTRLGERVLAFWDAATDMLRFVGEVLLAIVSVFAGRNPMRWRELAFQFSSSGPAALPIVSLISVLIGLVLAFVGAVQLRHFGAEIYIADLVALGMSREMGAMMTGIIVAGRTGAAFAAELGSMQANEEIDAIRTFGIDPMSFLVAPRVLALSLAMPLLTLYADLLGMIGGMLVSCGMMGLSVSEYYHQSLQAVGLVDFGVGLLKGSVFGVLIALAGCMRGMQSGRNSAAVGMATTSAVVTSIVAIVVADSILTVLYDALGW
ncbi:MAG TPA: MlaE family lipid ABC transporter permease subunit [Chromatiaceae bacterium]|nr:MlaE family lipid ABC transporter permease subunit [Chromatiaceae bacterium]